MSTDFATPASANGIQWADLKGSLLIFTVHGQEIDVQTTFGKADPVRADVHVVDGDQSGEEYSDVLVFPRALVGQLKTRVGSRVLGRLSQGTAKPGQSAPWLLQDPTEMDVAAAKKALGGGAKTPPANRDEDTPF